MRTTNQDKVDFTETGISRRCFLGVAVGAAGCAMAHEFDVYVHVDGAQSWGALDLDLKDMDCESFSASSHKWFCSLKETGISYFTGREDANPSFF